MYRRDLLIDGGGFDERLRRCEDYDVYLRMARRFPMTGYSGSCRRVPAARRQHVVRRMGHAARRARRPCAHRPVRADPRALEAWREGRRGWRRYYGQGSLPAVPLAQLVDRAVDRSAGGARAVSPAVAAREAFVVSGTASCGSCLARRLRGMWRWLGEPPAVGRVRLGDLGRSYPISRDFGFDRGMPIDRYYIERFLARHAVEIVGRVLEVGGDEYTRRFGGARVTRRDVLHVHPGNPRATIVGDLTDPQCFPRTRSIASCSRRRCS